MRGQLRTYSLLGLFKKECKDYLTEVEAKSPKEEVPEEVKTLAEQRWQAKKAKDWALADELRAKIDALGYAVKDSKEGYEVVKK